MFNLPTWLWNILAITVFISINLILWLHSRRCKAKGVDPELPFDRFKKHEKKINKWADIFIIVIILFSTIGFGGSVFAIVTILLSHIPFEYQQTNTRLMLSNLFLMFLYYSTCVSVMSSLLSPFYKNITLKKRIILVVLCCVPLAFGTLFYIFDISLDSSVSIKLLLGSLFAVLFINWPPIILGQPFVEFFPRLLSKIPFLPKHEC